MSKNRIENSLHREIEQLRKSIETLASFPDIDLAELYVAKKCAARILGVCYRTLERWYNSGYIELHPYRWQSLFPEKRVAAHRTTIRARYFDVVWTKSSANSFRTVC